MQPDLPPFLIATTASEWFNLQLGFAEDLNLPTTAWDTDAPELVLMDVNANVLQLLGAPVSGGIRGGFLSYAEKGWLDIVAYDVHETERKPPVAATSPVVFANTTDATYPVDAGDYITVRRTGSDVTYIVDGPFTIPANGSTPAPGLPGSLLATCTVPGVIGSAVAGQINVVVDALPGVSVTNPTAAYGRDEEQDDALRERSRLAASATSPAGPKNAYEYVVLGALKDDGTGQMVPLDITDVLAIGDALNGGVVCIFASDTGPSVDVAFANQLVLENVVPLGVDYIGYSAVAKVVNVSYTAYAKKSAGYSADEIKTAALAELVALFREKKTNGDRAPPGYPGLPAGILSGDEIMARISEASVGPGNMSVRPIYRVLPIPDVVYAFGQKAILGTVTANVVLL